MRTSTRSGTEQIQTPSMPYLHEPSATEGDKGEESVASETCPPAGGTGSPKPPPSKTRDAKKKANDGNEGLLMNRGEFRKGAATGVKEFLISGVKKDCLADAIAQVIGDDNKKVRDFLGEDRSFNRAIEYIATNHPDWVLDDISKSMLEAPNGVAVALLNSASGKFVLQMMYKTNGEKRYHCAALDMGAEWGPVNSVDVKTKAIVVKSGRGILFDNQADVKVHLAELSDREKGAARKFFSDPYPNINDMRITRVYKIVANKTETREGLRKTKRQRF